MRNFQLIPTYSSLFQHISFPDLPGGGGKETAGIVTTNRE
jgi:hypothetical protein